MVVWTKEKEEELLKLVTEGNSFAQIAIIMGMPSRNMPLCKFNRLKEKDPTLTHPGNINRSPVNKMKTVREPKFPPAPKAPPPKALELIVARLKEDGNPFMLEDLGNHTCRFPIGDPQVDLTFCGQEPKKDSPYCADHHAVCYTPIVKKPKVEKVGGKVNRAYGLGHHRMDYTRLNDEAA